MMMKFPEISEEDLKKNKRLWNRCEMMIMLLVCFVQVISTPIATTSKDVIQLIQVSGIYNHGAGNMCSLLLGCYLYSRNII